MESVVRPLLEAGALDKARETIARHLKGQGKPTAEALAEAAYWSCQANDFEAAKELYQLACDKDQMHHTYHYNLASVCRITGDLVSADEALTTHLGKRADDAEALWLQASLTRAHPSQRVQRLKDILSKSLPPKQQVHAWYALGKVHEDQGEYTQSFAAYSSGATLRRRYLKYDVTQDQAIMDAIKTSVNARFFQKKCDSDAGRGLIFIVGMPRSGTTLVENILAGHDAVAMGGELNIFSQALMKRIAQAGELSSMQQAIIASTRIDLAAVGATYEQGVTAYRNHDRWLTDKLPLNFLYLGLIRQALPNARIIHVSRAPMDTIWSVYKHLFTHAYPFSYSLEEIAHYYLAYRELMTHWRKWLGNSLLEVQYENLAISPAATVPEITRFCGIAFDHSALALNNNCHSVTTGSAAQIRESVHTRNIGQWRHFAKELEPARKILLAGGLAVDSLS